LDRDLLLWFTAHAFFEFLGITGGLLAPKSPGRPTMALVHSQVDVPQNFRFVLASAL
jgi:hypothetical protein